MYSLWENIQISTEMYSLWSVVYTAERMKSQAAEQILGKELDYLLFVHGKWWKYT